MTANSQDDQGVDRSLGFVSLERSADGLLVVLSFGFLVTALAVFLFHGALLRNGMILAGGWLLTGALGYFTSERLGRGFAGGVVLWRWVRALLLVALVIAFVGGSWIGVFRAAEPARAVPAKAP